MLLLNRSECIFPRNSRVQMILCAMLLLNRSECIFPRNSRVQMILCAMLLCSIAHSIICTRLLRGKMHSDWFNGTVILQGRWQHGEKVGYCYPSGLESSIAHSIICTRLFRGKMHSDWFNGIEILQGRWQHGEKVGCCYPSGLEKALCKWDIYVSLVTKGLNTTPRRRMESAEKCAERTFLLWFQAEIFCPLQGLAVSFLVPPGLMPQIL